MQTWSCARYNLGLTDVEFYLLTPRKFDALLKRHRHKVESQELLFGQLTSWMVNTAFRTTEKPTEITDFMPSRWNAIQAHKRQTKSKRRKRATIATEVRSVMAHFMR